MSQLLPSARRCVLLLLAAAPFAALAQAGGVGIGTAGAPDPSAALDVSSSTQGLLPPRLSQAQRDGIAAPAAGLLVFNTTTGRTNQWDGTRWTEPLALEAPATFAYTGGAQTYTVPASATSLRVDLAGASGGAAANQGAPGLGGRVQAVLAVTPGEVLTLYVGGAGSGGTGGYNGGGSGFAGGGGATDLRQGGSGQPNRVLVAGGGGGTANIGGSNPPGGGCGGGLVACNGGQTYGTGGAGGGQTGSGPNGGAGNTYGGGGGGGYQGGGGGTSAGGGGGSSYAGPGTSGVTHTPGAQAGNGYVRLTPGALAPALPAPVLDASNFVGLPAPQTLSLSGQSLGISGGNTVTLPPADNLGNHTATQDLNLAGNQLLSANRLGVGTATPALGLDVAGAGASLGLRNAAAWDHLYLSHDGGTAFVSAGGADLGLALRVGTGGTGTYGGQTYTEALRLLPSGRVGLGTSTPVALLDVNGNQNLTGTLQINTGDVDKIFLTDQGAAGSKISSANGWGVLSYAGPGNMNTGFHAWLTSTGSGYEEQLRLTGTGLGLGLTPLVGYRLAVGTAANQSGLYVKLNGASANQSLKLEHNGSNLIVRPTSAGGTSTVVENTGGGGLLLNPGGGDVGIGTAAAPRARLDVNGSAFVTNYAHNWNLGGATPSSYT